ncbi:MAG: hemolysin family protein [Dehalococcoidia bacterium]|nr:hemolysin family protein [Dehalococcoidia bacterium]
MEIDSLLAIFVLVASILAFAGVGVFQAAFLPLGLAGGLPWPEGDVPARPVRKLIARYHRTAILLALLRMASGLAAGLSLGHWAVQGAGGTWALAALVGMAALFVMILLEGVAQALGRLYYRGILLVASPIVVGASWVLNPVLSALEQVGMVAQRRRRTGADSLGGGQPENHDGDVLSHPVEAAVRGADAQERQMIRAILSLEDVPAREIMVPRVDILSTEVSTSLQEVAALMAQGGHSRILVYQESIDNVVGIVHARDVLQSLALEGSGAGLADISRPALFIPDSMSLDQLLKEFQGRHASIAVVVDEYGGTEGLVTIEDLLEEIVGEIEDEFATKGPTIVRISESEAVIDGRVTVEEVNELFETQLEGDGFHTVAGLLSNHLGRIPTVGDSVVLEGLTLRVLSTTGRRVRQVSVTRELPQV